VASSSIPNYVGYVYSVSEREAAFSMCKLTKTIKNGIDAHHDNHAHVTGLEFIMIVTMISYWFSDSNCIIAG